MKTMTVLLGALFIAGCSYQGEKLSTYLENPGTIVKDPHYSHYQEDKDTLESSYLNKEINYADYIKKLEELDTKYTKEVQDRTSIIVGPTQ